MQQLVIEPPKNSPPATQGDAFIPLPAPSDFTTPRRSPLPSQGENAAGDKQQQQQQQQQQRQQQHPRHGNAAKGNRRHRNAGAKKWVPPTDAALKYLHHLHGVSGRAIKGMAAMREAEEKFGLRFTVQTPKEVRRHQQYVERRAERRRQESAAASTSSSATESPPEPDIDSAKTAEKSPSDTMNNATKTGEENESATE